MNEEIERKLNQIEADLNEARENQRQVELSEHFAHANMVEYGKYNNRVSNIVNQM